MEIPTYQVMKDNRNKIGIVARHISIFHSFRSRETLACAHSTKNQVSDNCTNRPMDSSKATKSDSSTTTHRIEMAYDALTPETIKMASTLTLLLERARDLSATLSRRNRSITASIVTEFTYESGEGEGDIASRVARLTNYCRRMVKEVEIARSRIYADASAKQRWKKSNKVGSFLKQRMREIYCLVVSGLFSREIAKTQDDWSDFVDGTSQRNSGAVSMETGGVAAPSNVTSTKVVSPLYSEIEEDDARRERETAMEDAGIEKPSRGEKLIARRVQTYNEGNVEFALPVKQLIENRQATRRFARARKKQRKTELREYCRELKWKNRKPDPPSGDEGSGSLGV